MLKKKRHDSEIVETFNVFSSSFFMRRVTIIGYTGNMLPRKRTEKAKPTESNWRGFKNARWIQIIRKKPQPVILENPWRSGKVHLIFKMTGKGRRRKFLDRSILSISQRNQAAYKTFFSSGPGMNAGSRSCYAALLMNTLYESTGDREGRASHVNTEHLECQRHKAIPFYHMVSHIFISILHEASIHT